MKPPTSNIPPPPPRAGEGRGGGGNKARASTRTPALKPFARRLKQNMSDAEKCLWRQLRGKRLHGIKFRRQQIIGRYIVDFVSMEHKLVVELDGGQHAHQAAADAERTGFLVGAGYRVFRFWNHEALQQTDAVLEKIAAACDRQTKAENPPPPEATPPPATEDRFAHRAPSSSRSSHR